jgi:Dolichyl-phosphate-mannose-protein mannosyltransferase
LTYRAGGWIDERDPPQIDRYWMLGSDPRQRIVLRCVVYTALFTILCLLVQLAVGAYRSDHSQAGDEASYFVSSLMIADYVGHHLLSNPLTFAKEYYQHFPRIALGHYPPMFDLVQATLFLVFGRPGTTAVASAAVIGGLCAGLPAAIVSRLGIVLGLAAGIAVLSVPSVLFLVSTVMADNLSAVLVTLSALAWVGFYHRRTWFAALLFALLAAAAILTKGTGFGLALLPPIYLILKKDFRFIYSKRAIFSACIVMILVVPWYVATYRLAAAGFVYYWGWHYTRLAVPFFLRSLVASLGIPIIFCYVAGLCFAVAGYTKDEPFDIDAFVATSLAMLIIPMIAPADLAERYVIPVVPSAVIVAAWGLQKSLDTLLPSIADSPVRRRLISSSLCAAVFLLSAASVFQRPHIEPYHAGRVVADIVAAHQPNPLVLVSGSATLEGAVISSFAERHHPWSYYVVRATAVLARGNFMGTNYTERFDTPAAMAAWIKQSQIGWVVVQAPKNVFPHNAILRAALASNLLGARLVASMPTRRDGGSDLLLYVLPAVDTAPPRSDPLFAELKPSHRL